MIYEGSLVLCEDYFSLIFSLNIKTINKKYYLKVLKKLRLLIEKTKK